MPNDIDESATLAQALVTSVHELVNMVDNRRFHSAHDAADAIRRSMSDIDRGLVALRGGLLRELDLRLDAERQRAEAAVPNPYRLVRRRGGTEGEQLSGLSVADLLERTRYYYWWYCHEPHPYQRWNVSKRFSELRREVVARGLEHDAWMDGTEVEDA